MNGRRDALRRKLMGDGFTIRTTHDDYDVFTNNEQSIFMQYKLKTALFVREGMKSYITKLDFRKDLYKQVSIGLVKFRLGVQE